MLGLCERERHLCVHGSLRRTWGVLSFPFLLYFIETSSLTETGARLVAF